MVDKKVIFIIGVGRSGTSLLQSMLHAHSEICFIPEAQYVKHYMRRKSVQREHENAGPEAFLNVIKEDEYLKKSGVNLSDCIREASHDEPFSLANVFRSYLTSYSDAADVRYLGEKDARNLDFLEQLKANFPNSKVLLIIRDPRDVVLSKTKAAWSSGRPYWLHALIGNAQLILGQKEGERFFGESFMELRYEDLLAQPEQTLGGICKFLEIDYEEEMLRFHINAGELFKEKRELQYKYNNFKPLIKKNSEKWKQEFSSSKIRFIEMVSRKTMEQNAYENYTSQNIFARFFGSILSSLFIVVYRFIRKYL